MKLYNQNIWGNMKSSSGDRIANRNLLIRDLIQKYAPNACTFQECNPKTSRTGDTPIASLLAFGYEEVLPELADRNFTPVFYNRNTTELLDSGYFLFDGKNDKNSKSVTWAILCERATKKCFAVLSVHFWWKWESEEDDEQRKANARQLAAFCKELYEKYPIPFLVAGDLNSGIGSHQGNAAYNEMLALGMLDTRDLATDSTDMLTAHDYPILNEDGRYVNGGEPIKTLDYIFSFLQQPKSLDRFAVLTEPDALNSSDHCPLILDFEI